jgi:lantibiotic transport system permease protein
MSFIISTQAELLKTKRTASFWLSIIGAAFIPTILFIALFTDGDAEKNLAKEPWAIFMNMGWQILTVFLLPVYIILVSTLITQIEIKNNTWKQVFASPQTFANIYFSKFVAIHIMIIFCYLLFNVLMISSAVLANLFNDKYHFLSKSIDWKKLLQLNARTYISILGISAIQYWLSLRFKNFIGPVGIGLALVVCSIIAMNYQWPHLHKYPYAFPSLSFDAIQKSEKASSGNHELYSAGYFVLFILIGFIDLKFRKEKG